MINNQTELNQLKCNLIEEIFRRLKIFLIFDFNLSKQVELQEECRVLSGVMKSLEASEQEAKQREENFAELMREYTQELKEVN